MEHHQPAGAEAGDHDRAAGQGDDPKYPGWNDFILHNSQRPNAKAFRNGAAPSLANGNILLVTEEDYEQPDCSQAGSFQTWWVKRLDGTKNAIVPLDKVELSDLGNFPLPVGRSAPRTGSTSTPRGSSRPGSTAAAPSSSTYATRRTSSPTATPPGALSEVWDSYWMPVYSKSGVMTAKKTNLAYSVDLARGIDVYRVDLPGLELGHQRGLRRSDQWRLGRPAAPLVGVLARPADRGPRAPSYDEPRGRLRSPDQPRHPQGKPDCSVQGPSARVERCAQIPGRDGVAGSVGNSLPLAARVELAQQHRRRHPGRGGSAASGLGDA